MATYERLDYGSADGCQIGGAATDKVGFYGATPVVKAAIVATGTDTATTQAAVNSVIALLKTYGLMATA